MKASALELDDIFRHHGPAYLTSFGASLSHKQGKALRAIALCRTAALGGHVNQCDECGYREILLLLPQPPLSEAPRASASAMARTAPMNCCRSSISTWSLPCRN